MIVTMYRYHVNIHYNVLTLISIAHPGLRSIDVLIILKDNKSIESNTMND